MSNLARNALFTVGPVHSYVGFYRPSQLSPQDTAAHGNSHSWQSVARAAWPPAYSPAARASRSDLPRGPARFLYHGHEPTCTDVHGEWRSPIICCYLQADKCWTTINHYRLKASARQPQGSGWPCGGEGTRTTIGAHDSNSGTPDHRNTCGCDFAERCFRIDQCDRLR